MQRAFSMMFTLPSIFEQPLPIAGNQLFTLGTHQSQSFIIVWCVVELPRVGRVAIEITILAETRNRGRNVFSCLLMLRALATFSYVVGTLQIYFCDGWCHMIFLRNVQKMFLSFLEGKEISSRVSAPGSAKHGAFNPSKDVPQLNDKNIATKYSQLLSWAV